MYNVVPPGILQKATEFILQTHRAPLVPFWQCALDYAAGEPRLLVSGSFGVSGLTRGGYEPSMVLLEFYTTRANVDARRIAEAMTRIKHRTLDPQTTSVQTVLKNKELVVRVGTQPVVKIYGIQAKSFEIVDNLGTRVDFKLERPIGPELEPIRLSGKVTVARPELLGQQIAHSLYNLMKAGDWLSGLETIRKIFLGGREGGAASGAAIALLKDYYPAYLSPRERDIVGGVEQDMIEELADSEGFLRVDLPGYVGQPKFITSADPNLIQAALRKRFGNVGVMTGEICAPANYALTKHTFYKDGKTKEYLCDIYNNTTHEIVPHRGKVASPAVAVYLALIDISTFKAFDILHSRIKTLEHAVRGLLESDDWFTETEFEGVYVSEAVLRNQVIRSAEQLPPYYPSKIQNRGAETSGSKDGNGKDGGQENDDFANPDGFQGGADPEELAGATLSRTDRRMIAELQSPPDTIRVIGCSPGAAQCLEELGELLPGTQIESRTVRELLGEGVGLRQGYVSKEPHGLFILIIEKN